MLLLVLYFALIDMSYTWLPTVCLANTCKDFMRLYEYACWPVFSGSTCHFVGFACTGSFTVLVHDALSAVVVHKFFRDWITHKARKNILILNQIAVLTHPYILYG